MADFNSCCGFLIMEEYPEINNILLSYPFHETTYILRITIILTLTFDIQKALFINQDDN